jgi:hypothetical protein
LPCLLKAYIDPGYVADDLAPGQPKPKLSWRKKKKLRHAAVSNAARTVQRILYDSASGVTEAYGPAIRVLQVTHEVMQPGKGDNSSGGPIMHRFARAPQAAVPTPVEPSPADEPGSVVDRQGKLYVDGDA